MYSLPTLGWDYLFNTRRSSSFAHWLELPVDFLPGDFFHQLLENTCMKIQIPVSLHGVVSSFPPLNCFLIHFLSPSCSAYTLSNFEIRCDVTRGRLRISLRVTIKRVSYATILYTTPTFYLWNTQYTACDITSNLEVEQSVWAKRSSSSGVDTLSHFSVDESTGWTQNIHNNMYILDQKIMQSKFSTWGNLSLHLH